MKSQRGGTILGFVLGLLVGLGIALGVSIYVTKVPLPFVNKGLMRGTDQNDAESKKNKDWDPNALLSSKPAAKASVADAASSDAAPAISSTPPTPATPAAPAVPTHTKAEEKAAASADPIGALAKSKGANADAPQVAFYVQVGAFRTAEDAQARRAKLALSGVDAKITERDQGGRPLFRVRVGPFDKLEDAERANEKLEKAGNETALVKVQR
jgi:cell division protein FtsN